MNTIKDIVENIHSLREEKKTVLNTLHKINAQILELEILLNKKCSHKWVRDRNEFNYYEKTYICSECGSEKIL